MEQLNKFLSLFGSPGLFMYPDAPDGARPNGFDSSKYNDLETCLSVNSAMAFALAFRPAGNLAKTNTIGQKINVQDVEEYLPAIWFDIDLNEKCSDDGINSVQDLMDHVTEMAGKHNLPLGFVTKTVRGVHCWFMLEESARRESYRKHKNKLDGIQRNFAESFGYYDSNAIGIKRLMRLPFTKHWKTGIPLDIELYRADWGPDGDKESPTLVKCTKPEDIFMQPHKCITYGMMEHYSAYADEKIEVDAGSDLRLRMEVASDMEKVNRVPMADVLHKLEKYPREHGNMIQTFKLYKISGKTGYIDIDLTNQQTGEIVRQRTEGYRLNVEGNYVNCFSKELHPIEERPRGSTYPFLHYYFRGNTKLIRDFLQAEFSLNLHERRADAVMVPLATSSGDVIFTKNDVIYKKKRLKKDGNVTETEVVLFRTPVRVAGVIETKYFRKGELAKPQSFYVLERLDRTDDKRFIVEFVEDRKKFNRKYGPMQFMFHGQEEDLLDFYLAMNFAVRGGQVPAFNYEWLNGWRGNRFVIGKHIWSVTESKFVPSANDAYYANEDITFSLAGKDEIKAKEFLDNLKKNWSPRVATCAFLGFCTAFLSADYWKFVAKAKAEFIVPGLFLTGLTKVGKSTLISTMKESVGLTSDSRKLSVRSTSLQPLKQMGTDNFLMHIEEFTGDIRSDKESIVRDIINRAKSGTGLITGDNIEFTYRASMVIDGERLPVQESVTNRCVMVPMFETDRTGSPDSLSALRGKSIFKDLLISAADWRKSEPELKFLQAEKDCMAKGLADRKAMIGAYLLCMWRMLKMGDESLLFDILADNFGIGSRVDANDEPLTCFLNDMIVSKRISATLDKIGTSCEINVPVPADVSASKRVEIVGLLRKYPKHCQFKNNTFIIKYDTKEDADIDNKLRALHGLFRMGMFV